MTVFTNQQKLGNASSLTYNDATLIYDDTRYNYNGQLIVKWTNQTKS